MISKFAMFCLKCLHDFGSKTSPKIFEASMPFPGDCRYKPDNSCPLPAWANPKYHTNIRCASSSGSPANDADDQSKAKAKAKEDVDAQLTVLTHTNQVWDLKDYRNVRFLNAKRLVNPRFAMHLKHNSPKNVHNGRIVACNGGHDTLGHPVVFYNLDKPGYAYCFYCGRSFINSKYSPPSGGVQTAQK